MNVRYRVELTQSERDELTALLSGGRHAVRELKRAQILLAADAGTGDERHQPAGCIVDEGNEGATWPTIFEPGMIGTIDLHEFANAFAAIARLVNRGEAVPAVDPESVFNHPVP